MHILPSNPDAPRKTILAALERGERAVREGEVMSHAEAKERMKRRISAYDRSARETAHLMRSPKNAQRLTQAIKSLEARSGAAAPEGRL